MIRRNTVEESFGFVKNLKDGREFFENVKDREENFSSERRQKNFFIIIIVIHQVTTTQTSLKGSYSRYIYNLLQISFFTDTKNRIFK